jgi:hypothetical protein
MPLAMPDGAGRRFNTADWWISSLGSGAGSAGRAYHGFMSLTLTVRNSRQSADFEPGAGAMRPLQGLCRLSFHRSSGWSSNGSRFRRGAFESYAAFSITDPGNADELMLEEHLEGVDEWARSCLAHGTALISTCAARVLLDGVDLRNARHGFGGDTPISVRSRSRAARDRLRSFGLRCFDWRGLVWRCLGLRTGVLR